MKMVPFEEPETPLQTKSENIIDSIYLKTSPYLKKASELDNIMKKILELDIDEDLKTKLYVQSLRKFLVYKNKIHTEKNVNLDNIVDDKKIDEKRKILIDLDEETEHEPELSTNTSSLPGSMPIATSSRFVVDLNKKTPKVKVRNQKLKAKQKLHNLFEETTEESSEDERSPVWQPYNAPKKIRSIRRLKSGKKSQFKK
jgi:hypothetical protein